MPAMHALPPGAVAAATAAGIGQGGQQFVYMQPAAGWEHMGPQQQQQHLMAYPQVFQQPGQQPPQGQMIHQQQPQPQQAQQQPAPAGLSQQVDHQQASQQQQQQQHQHTAVYQQRQQWFAAQLRGENMGMAPPPGIGAGNTPMGMGAMQSLGQSSMASAMSSMAMPGAAISQQQAATAGQTPMHPAHALPQ
eukprot:scpid105664/ scgid18456/ 